MRIRQISSLRFALFAVASFTILLLFSATFPNIEWLLYDYRVRLAARLSPDGASPSGQVVVIGIDGYKSLKDKPLIFWYPQIAECIRTAATNGAAAIALDLIPYHSLAEKLQAVMQELRGPDQAAEGNIGKDLDHSLITALVRSSVATPILQGYNGDVVPFYYGMMAHMPNALPVSLQISFDEDGVLRRSRAADQDESPRLVAGVCGATGLCAPEQSFLVNFRMLDAIRTVDFGDFLAQRVPAEEMAGKIVLIGMVNGNEDNVPTPLGLRNGIFFHAAALETLLTGNTVRLADPWLSTALLAALCLAGVLVSSTRPPRPALVLLLLATAAYGAANLWLFCRGTVLPAAPHLFALGLTAALVYPYRYLAEERDKLRLKETFSYYVDKSVIEKLITRDARHLMEGEQRNVTVLALDIRDFTGLSNAYPPETVVALLNHLFSKFTEIVQSHGGFVNKFIGDGLLAFFIGEDSPTPSLDSAMAIHNIVQHMNMQKELHQFIQDRPVNIGIGLHYGPAILGNIGSSRKMDFTVIGPTVNLAFRVESVTKELGATILATGEVHERARQDYAFRHLGAVSVKGFADRIEVYSPLQRTH